MKLLDEHRILTLHLDIISIVAKSIDLGFVLELHHPLFSLVGLKNSLMFVLLDHMKSK